MNADGAATQIDLQFPRPARSAAKIEKLSGEFVVAVPSEKHKYVFENFGNGKRQSEKFGEVTVTLESARRNGSVFEMRILAEFKTGPRSSRFVSRLDTFQSSLLAGCQTESARERWVQYLRGQWRFSRRSISVSVEFGSERLHVDLRIAGHDHSSERQV